MRRATSRLLPWSAALLLLATGLAADTRTGICQSIDIRNYPVQMEKLRGCRIIEGELSIVLMERVNAESFQNMSFPDLREVTDFIKIYRMRGIRNLGDLFPNLTVVRGIRLFKDYALVIFDNENLETLGLRSLARIERGAIRIQHNDRLCYTNTVDWSKIIAEGTENNIIKSNYDSRLCGLCPDAPGRMEDHRNRIGDQCPADNKGRLLCWDDRHCQKLCATRCGDRGCLASGECCHAACLGGCDGPQPTDCHVCRNFSIGYGSERTCVERCPGHTYELVRRCVTEQECRSIPPPRPTSNPALGNTYRSTPTIEAFKIYNRTCIYHCPTGYMEVGDEKNATCELCHGCVRECTGGKVNSVASAELFRGCTHVKGTLEIMLRSSGGNTMAVLESSLGDILEIDGCLKVVRSFPLVSLMFLKSLKTITGKDCPSTYRGQTLHIFNNPNLELLWDWEVHGDIDIQTGTVFIHFNPKLCFESKLSKLKGMIRDPASTFDDMEVSRDNNGDQASCLQAALNLTVQTIGPVFAILTWNNFCLDDMRRLLGYSIYYLPTEQNVTLYGQRDACSDTWNVVDLTFDETRMNATLPTPRVNDGLPIDCNDKEPHFHPLTKLVPFTRYAAYVKTFTTQQDKKGAQSQIIYFRTLPGRPSPPTDLEVDMKTPHSVFISWKPPAMPNGTISIYHVEIQANTYNRQKILARPAQDYCGNPNSLANAIAARVEDSTKKKEEKIANEKAAQCDCSKIDEEEEDSQMTRFNWLAEEERQESINFENDLQNEVYVKTDRKNKTPNNRTRRSIQESREVIPKSMLVILSGNISPQPGLKYSNSTDLKVKCSRIEPNVCVIKDNVTGYVKSLYYDLDGSTKNLHIEKMRHFTWYTVNIWACRAKHPNETEKDYNETWCSEREHYIFRTLEEIGVDMVHNVQAEIVPSNKTLPEVNVTWEPPGNPNGFVVAYNVHHSLVDDTAQQTQDVGLQACVMADDFEANGRSYLIRNLAAGNYSIRVTPLTVSGAGNVSSQVYIYIPERRAESGYLWVWGVVAGCACTALLAGAGVWHARRGLRAANDNNKLFASVNPEYVATVYVPDEWEVPRANIEFIRELGQGSFGMVYEGLAKNMQKGKPETRCAVKTVNEHATDRERIEFLNEASVMKAFDTFHVVRLLGVVSRGQPTLVVMELMERGDLKTYLRSHRPDQDGSLSKNEPPRAPPTLQNILQMAIEIADGMAYLAAKKFVHRDLAARNCMVAGDLTVKVGDFGMTRDIYETDYYRKGTKGLLPVRWMSPESLKDGVFSSSSDVWSYGVVLWEMATLAMQPYQGLSNEQVVRYVIEGGVMERPEHCPDRLYDLMRACWAHRAAQRPSFLRLVADLAPTCMPYFRQRSFFHSPLGQELYSLQAANLEEEAEMPEVNVGAAATGSGSNLFGVSGRLASWVRELSSLRSRSPDDAAAEPLQPAPAPKGPNGVATSHC